MKELIKIGDRYGRLEVIGRENDYEYKRNYFEKMWLCRCDCGKERVIKQSRLRNGSIKSCGCLNKEVHSKIGGLSKHPLYKKWQSMKRRCHSPSAQAYSNYGARGISVCEEWRKSFLSFYNWCIENGYDAGSKLSLERIDNNGDYCPENCRWASYTEQQNNKRRSRKITWNGKTQTIAQWERDTGISRYTITGRLNRGCSPEEALTKIDNVTLRSGENVFEEKMCEMNTTSVEIDGEKGKTNVVEIIKRFNDGEYDAAMIEWGKKYKSIESAFITMNRIIKKEGLRLKMKKDKGKLYMIKTE